MRDLKWPDPAKNAKKLEHMDISSTESSYSSYENISLLYNCLKILPSLWSWICFQAGR